LRRALVEVVLIGVLVFTAVVSLRPSSAVTPSNSMAEAGVGHSASTVEAGFSTPGFLQTGKSQGSHPQRGKRSRRSKIRWMPECALDVRPSGHVSFVQHIVADKPTYKGRWQQRIYTPPDTINA
jgi:hypothetical protein